MYHLSREFKVELPPDLESHCFIEFSDAKAAKAALKDAHQINQTFEKVTDQLFRVHCFV